MTHKITHHNRTIEIGEPRHLAGSAGGSRTTIETKDDAGRTRTYYADQYPYDFAELHTAHDQKIGEARKARGQWFAQEDPERHHTRTGHTAEQPSRHQPHTATGSTAEEALARLVALTLDESTTPGPRRHQPANEPAPTWARY